jgi:hypothetical protein
MLTELHETDFSGADEDSYQAVLSSVKVGTPPERGVSLFDAEWNGEWYELEPSAAD